VRTKIRSVVVVLVAFAWRDACMAEPAEQVPQADRVLITDQENLVDGWALFPILRQRGPELLEVTEVLAVAPEQEASTARVTAIVFERDAASPGRWRGVGWAHPYGRDIAPAIAARHRVQNPKNLLCRFILFESKREAQRVEPRAIVTGLFVDDPVAPLLTGVRSRPGVLATLASVGYPAVPLWDRLVESAGRLGDSTMWHEDVVKAEPVTPIKPPAIRPDGPVMLIE